MYALADFNALQREGFAVADDKQFAVADNLLDVHWLNVGCGLRIANLFDGGREILLINRYIFDVRCWGFFFLSEARFWSYIRTCAEESKEIAADFTLFFFFFF